MVRTKLSQTAWQSCSHPVHDEVGANDTHLSTRRRCSDARPPGLLSDCGFRAPRNLDWNSSSTKVGTKLLVAMRASVDDRNRRR